MFDKKEWFKEYMREHPEHYRKASKKYYHKNKEKILQIQKERRELFFKLSPQEILKKIGYYENDR